MSLSEIYNAYKVDFDRQQEEKDKEMKRKLSAHLGKKNKPKKSKLIVQNQGERSLLNVSKMYEKIISFNCTGAIAQGENIYLSNKKPIKLCNNEFYFRFSLLRGSI